MLYQSLQVNQFDYFLSLVEKSKIEISRLVLNLDKQIKRYIIAWQLDKALIKIRKREKKKEAE
jgi:hypothetical protein